MSVWQEVARYKLPVVCLHQHSGQSEGCLAGLVHYASQIAQNKHTYAFRTPYSITAWLSSTSVASAKRVRWSGCSSSRA